MARWIGFVDDPTAGGSTLEDLESLQVPAPTLFLPVNTGQADPGLQQLERTNEIRGRRAHVAPISFASSPAMTFEARAYPKLLRKILRNALGGAPSSSGTPPAAVSTTIGTLQSGNLPSLIGWLLREGQLDRMTGLVVGEIELNFAIDEEGTVSATLPGLWHKTDDSAAPTDDPDGDPPVAIPSAAYSGFEDSFMLRDAQAFTGDTPVELPNFAGFGLTFSNGLIDNFRSRFQPGHNIETVVVDGVTHKVWYPYRHRLGPQAVTGRLDFSDVMPDREVLRQLAHADKLVFEVAAGPLGTTPEADEMLRLVVHKHVLTGGGAEPLQRDDDQVASFEFGGFLDTSVQKDLEAVFVGAAALT